MKLIKKIAVCLAIVLTISAAGMQQVFAKESIIKDISLSDDAYSNVEWVISQGYMSLALGKFLPAKFVKRGEFAAIVNKLSGNGTEMQNPATPSFKDVPYSYQFYRQIETVKDYFVVYKSGTGKLFKPNAYLTREDAMMAIARVLGYDSDEAVSSNDNMDVSLEDVLEDADKVNPALMKYVAIGVSNGLMDLREAGDKIFFDPKKNITRKDLAVLIYNAYQQKDYNARENQDAGSDGEDDGNHDDDGSEPGTGGPSDQDGIPLPQVAQPYWTGASVNWYPAANALRYEVRLYRNDILIGMEEVVTGAISCDFTKYIAAAPSAVYKATVQAKGSGVFSDGPVSEPAEKVFSLQDFRLQDGEGISIYTDTTANTHTISIDGSKLPAELPGYFKLGLVSTDNISDQSVLNMVSYHQTHRFTTFDYTGRSGEYYRFTDDNRQYTLLLIFDADMNFIGYYTYNNP